MKYKHLIAMVVAAMMAVACGESKLPSSLGMGPSALGESTGNGVHKLSVRSVDPNASCPDGGVVSGLSVNIHNNVLAAITWVEVLGVADYRGEIYYYHADNTYHLVDTFVRDQLFYDYTLPQAGRYRVHVRTRSCDDQYGPWGEWVYFSTGGGTSSEPPAFVILPPGDEGGGGPTEPPVDPPCVVNCGGGDNGGGGDDSGDNNPPPVTCGVGFHLVGLVCVPDVVVPPPPPDDNTCHSNGSSGDHNNDGHHDCGNDDAGDNGNHGNPHNQ